MISSLTYKEFISGSWENVLQHACPPLNMSLLMDKVNFTFILGITPTYNFSLGNRIIKSPGHFEGWSGDVRPFYGNREHVEIRKKNPFLQIYPNPSWIINVHWFFKGGWGFLLYISHVCLHLILYVWSLCQVVWIFGRQGWC